MQDALASTDALTITSTDALAITITSTDALASTISSTTIIG